MRKLIVLYALLLVNGIQGFAQKDRIPQLDYKGQELYRFLAKNIKYPNELKTCDRVKILAAIRLKLDAKGKITFVEAVGNVGDTTKTHLREVILKTDGYWKPQIISGKPVASNLIILPIVFDLQNGCETSTLYAYDGFKKSINEVFDVAKGGEACIIYNLTSIWALKESIDN